MKPSRRFALLVSLVVAAGCDRGQASPHADSATVKPAGSTEAAAPARASTWNSSAGPVLLVAGDIPSHALIVFPDSGDVAQAAAAIPHPADVTLFSRGGTVQAAQLPALTDSGACATALVSAAPPPLPWNVGFIGGVVSPLATDSIEAISPADSARLVVWMNRLASALPNDSAGRFTGLPFVVRGLWRFKLPAGTPVVVATLMRQLNQEATPLQERTLLVAEQTPDDSSFSTGYSERHYGDEETIQNTELLATALLGPSRTPTIVVARDFGDANAFGFIERSGVGQWRVRWMSGRRHC